MNRTRKLMGSVTASVLLMGVQDLGFSAQRISTVASNPPPTQPDEAWKKDPEVGRAAEAIFEKLENTNLTDAKSLNEILKQVPGVKPNLAEQALKRLIWEGRIKRSGQGTNTDPYRWYERDTHTA
jgi:hypothetical protein